MPISQKPKDILHIVDVPSTDLLFLSNTLQKKYFSGLQTSMYKYCEPLSEPTILNNINNALSKKCIRN